MAIDIHSKLSSDDIESVRRKRQPPPEYERGFEPPEEDEDDFKSADLLGASSGAEPPAALAGAAEARASPNNALIPQGNAGQPYQQYAPYKKDRFDEVCDKIFDKILIAAGAVWRIATATPNLRGILSRESCLELGRAFAKLGKIELGIGLISAVSGHFVRIGIFHSINTVIMPITQGLLCVCAGLGLGWLSNGLPPEACKTKGGVDLNTPENGGFIDIDDEFDEPETPETQAAAEPEQYETPAEKPIDEFDFLQGLNDDEEAAPYSAPEIQTSPKPFLNRAVLLDTFKSALPLNAKGFEEIHELEPEGDLFAGVETLALKALASAKKADFREIKSELVRASESCFCYTLYLRRVSGLNNRDEIAKEMETYFREDSDDLAVSAECSIEGDFYKIVIFKGENHLITLGDCLKIPEVFDFFANPKNAPPLVVGVRANGKPLLADAKRLDSIETVGMPRMGKSWALLSKLFQMALFNPPTEVQFILIDPKNSALLRNLSLFPHFCGFHGNNVKNCLAVMRDVINFEGKRREKLLLDNNCDTLFELRRKGVNLPVLWIVIDEILTVIESMNAEQKKDFNSLLRIILTQYPSKGIRLYIVPHRATSIIDKTMRVNISYAEAIGATDEVIAETLGKAGNQRLTKPGDTPPAFRRSAENNLRQGRRHLRERRG
jgi:hypothetical protein